MQKHAGPLVLQHYITDRLKPLIWPHRILSYSLLSTGSI